MRIGVFGSGYLGTVLSACLADFGLPVTCCSGDVNRIAALAQGEVPFYEKNLQEIVRRNVRAGRLLYSTDFESFAARNEIIFYAEDTGRTIDVSVAQMAHHAGTGQSLVVCTPVAVGTANRLETQLQEAGCGMEVVSHPLFLTDGCAVEDFNWPDRIVVGTRSSDAVLRLKHIYRPLLMRGVPVIVTSHQTAELVREAATAFMATKLSFINELAGLCEHVDADAVDLSLALGLDKKIAPRCLQPGAGLGGAFAENDMDALARLAKEKGVSLRILDAAREVNRSLCDRIVGKLAAAMDVVSGKQVALLGLAFKPHTDSVAASASMELARRLVSKGAQLRAYDPAAMHTAQQELTSMRYCDTPYSAAEGADALVVSTAWPEFRSLDFQRIKRSLRHPLVVDTKNLLDGTRMRAMGFQYVGLGRA